MGISRKTTKKVARRYWPLGVSFAAVFVVGLLWAAAPVSDSFVALGDTVSSFGAIAPSAYVALFAVGTIILAPSPLLSIAAGVAFGWWGIPLALLGATSGATLSYLISRYFFRDLLNDWLTEHATFRAAKAAVDEEGWRVLVLLRLSPAVPFGILNYLLGVTKTSLPVYLVTTAVGITPGTVVDIYVGVVGAEAAHGTQLSYLIVGLAATMIIAAVITWKARSYLREEGVNV